VVRRHRIGGHHRSKYSWGRASRESHLPLRGRSIRKTYALAESDRYTDVS
jgi:hypothetical protein